MSAGWGNNTRVRSDVVAVKRSLCEYPRLLTKSYAIGVCLFVPGTRNNSRHYLYPVCLLDINALEAVIWIFWRVVFCFIGFNRFVYAELLGFLLDEVSRQVYHIIEVLCEIEVQDEHGNQYTHYLLYRRGAVGEDNHASNNCQSNA